MRLHIVGGFGYYISGLFTNQNTCCWFAKSKTTVAKIPTFNIKNKNGTFLPIYKVDNF